MSNSGQPYTALPNAFRYRKELTAGCSCRRPGQSWADALKNADDATTLESGDIVVTDQNAKALSQAPQAQAARPAAPAAQASRARQRRPSLRQRRRSTDPAKRTVRTVGPPFLSASQMQMQQQLQQQSQPPSR